MNTEKRFKNKYYECYFEDGIICVKYFPETVVDIEAAKITLRDRLAFAEGKSYAYYVDVRGAKYWTKEARTYQASDANHELVKAFAMHINSAVQRTIIKFYLYFNKPPIPTDCFTSKEAAIKWLQQYK